MVRPLRGDQCNLPGTPFATQRRDLVSLANAHTTAPGGAPAARARARLARAPARGRGRRGPRRPKPVTRAPALLRLNPNELASALAYQAVAELTAASTATVARWQAVRDELPLDLALFELTKRGDDAALIAALRTPSPRTTRQAYVLALLAGDPTAAARGPRLARTRGRAAPARECRAARSRQHGQRHEPSRRTARRRRDALCRVWGPWRRSASRAARPLIERRPRCVFGHHPSSASRPVGPAPPRPAVSASQYPKALDLDRLGLGRSRSSVPGQSLSGRRWPRAAPRAH
jgi:hypothetical protein